MRQRRIDSALAILTEEVENVVVIFEDRSPVSKREYIRVEHRGLMRGGADALMKGALHWGESRKDAIAADKEQQEDSDSEE